MRALTITLLAGALSLAGGAAMAQEGGKPFNVPLTGAAEAPGPGDADGTGTAVLRVNPGQSQVCYELKVAKVTLPAIGAHIHKAPVGQAGDVVAPLTAPGADGTSKGCAGISREMAQELIKSPDQYYVNVHTSDHPAGAVRGQLAQGVGRR